MLKSVINTATENGPRPLCQAKSSENHNKKFFRVTGPDTNCDESIHFTALIKDINAIRVTGSAQVQNEHYETEMKVAGGQQTENSIC